MKAACLARRVVRVVGEGVSGRILNIMGILDSCRGSGVFAVTSPPHVCLHPLAELALAPGSLVGVCIYKNTQRF